MSATVGPPEEPPEPVAGAPPDPVEPITPPVDLAPPEQEVPPLAVTPPEPVVPPDELAAPPEPVLPPLPVLVSPPDPDVELGPCWEQPAPSIRPVQMVPRNTKRFIHSPRDRVARGRLRGDTSWPDVGKRGETVRIPDAVDVYCLGAVLVSSVVRVRKTPSRGVRGHS